MEKTALFEINDEGWIAQNAGRDLTELFRELLQNALDGDGDTVRVRVNSRQREISIEDNGSGFERIEDSFQVFGGDKGQDPTKRGRFGRGLKEFVASTQYTKVETTVGTVEFDVENLRRRVTEEVTRNSGTKIVARNDEWSKWDVRDVWKFVRDLWVPEGVTIVVDLKEGRTEEFTREAPENTFTMRLETPVYNTETGKMETTKRRTEVHIRRASAGGTFYEMGIPVDTEAPFDWDVDVQQKVPMAEQRNEPDNYWYERRFQPKFVRQLWRAGYFEDMTDNELKDNWFTEALSSFRIPDEAKEYWTNRIVRDGRKSGLAVSDRDLGEQERDKLEQYGYQVFDASRAGGSVASIVKESTRDAKDALAEIVETEKEQVEPSEDEIEVLSELEQLAERVGYPNVTFETWKWDDSVNGRHAAAEHTDEGVIRLNVAVSDYSELTPEVVGTALHEIAHEVGVGHNSEWWGELELLAGKAILNYD